MEKVGRGSTDSAVLFFVTLPECDVQVEEEDGPAARPLGALIHEVWSTKEPVPAGLGLRQTINAAIWCPEQAAHSLV